MLSDERGFSTPLAMIVIFSLSIMISALCIFMVSCEKKINSYKKIIEARKDADRIIKEIEVHIQQLKENKCDLDSYDIEVILKDICENDFSIKDVSTGINLKFMKEAFIKSNPINEYITVTGDNVFTEYSWINPKIADENILNNITEDYDSKDLFPLVNNLPPLNIHNMSEDYIKAVLDFYHINTSSEKAFLIKDKTKSEISLKEIAELLEISENHPLFDWIGTKTIFWEIKFRTSKYSVNSVFAAIPEKNNQKKIEKYILIEKNILINGGSV